MQRDANPALASTLPPPALSPLESDSVLDVCLGAEFAPVCIVEGCSERAGWTTENLEDYCERHANEWLRAEGSK